MGRRRGNKSSIPGKGNYKGPKGEKSLPDVFEGKKETNVCGVQ